MKKLIRKSFDIEAVINGAKVQTRDGRTATYVGRCPNEQYPYVFYITGESQADTYDSFGLYRHYDPDHERNLEIVEEIEEPERWANDKEAKGEGWFISRRGVAAGVEFAKTVRLNDCFNYHAFATEKQAKSALAMARISQLMAHDERYGGVVTEEEWKDDSLGKYVIRRRLNQITKYISIKSSYSFLAFHTNEQRNLFLSENEQLVKDYLMID